MKLLGRDPKRELFLKGHEAVSWVEPPSPVQFHRLTLGWTTITDFPFQSAAFADLQELRLLNIEITEIPTAIFEMKQLKKLSVRGAELTQIADALVQLRELRELDFGNNYLTNFEVDLRAHRHLKWFQISDNPLEKLPSSLPPKAFLGLAGTPCRELNARQFRNLPK